ncbi:MAG TPA: HAD family phosphatase [Candidatus Saccharimonas sp.]|nr:HAD family phosphatase [Candidatus Saccharimonas sp.]
MARIIRNLVTDLDGTLVFNRQANVEAYVRAFRDVGVEFASDEYLKAFGLRFDAMIERVAPHLDEAGRQRVKERKKHHYAQVVELITPNQPLMDFLKAMRGTHKLGLATTASRHNALMIIEYFGLAETFDAMIFGEDVTHGKPHPECYALCIEKLGGRPDETLIFEDSETGMKAAEAAGAQVIRVATDEV